MIEKSLESLTSEFKKIMIGTEREGVQELLEWLDATDFYTAPASTRFHGSYKGGLLEHSLDVYLWLVKLHDFFLLNKVYDVSEPKDSMVIVALCHDFCKIGSYKTEMRWRKNEFNRWEQYPTYKFEEDFPFGGHGSKSVYIVQHFVRLEPHEAAAINCHMGPWDSSTYGNPGSVYEQNKLAWLLHVADESSTFCTKKEVI
jgi:hypothetical protein